MQIDLLLADDSEDAVKALYHSPIELAPPPLRPL